jgi:hypothetical protein
MNTVTDEDYHITFGLHSGIPLCCVLAFAEHGKGGPCPKCISAGVTKKELFSIMHWCDESTPACQPYLDIIELRIIHAYKERNCQGKAINLVKGEVDDYTWGCSFTRPMGDELRDLLRDDGFRMVHLCWPEPSTYWYIYQQVGGKKGKCGICNTKFSLAFPTAGKPK